MMPIKPNHWLFWVFAYTLHALMNLLYRFRVSGFEQIPETGPCIFVANHQSYLDVPAIGELFWRKKWVDQTFWVIGKQTSKRPVLKWFFSVSPLIVVNGTVKNAETALKSGFNLVVFPEGFYSWRKYKWLRSERKAEEPRLEVGRSAAILALKTGLPIVPIGLKGTYEGLPPYAVLPKPGVVELRIGTPFRFEVPEPEAVTDEMLKEKSELIMKRIDELRSAAYEKINA